MVRLARIIGWALAIGYAAAFWRELALGHFEHLATVIFGGVSFMFMAVAILAAVNWRKGS